MAFVQLAEGELHYQLDGPADAPVLVLSNSLGTDLHMWDAQIPAFTEHFRVLRFDTRGHGQSLVTPGPYSIEQLGHDVLALLDALAHRARAFLRAVHGRADRPVAGDQRRRSSAQTDRVQHRGENRRSVGVEPAHRNRAA